ncbi:MAG: universal stress protein [Thermoanaerobaculia bacterium]
MTREKQTILVGTSLDPSSDAVVAAGAALARGFGAELYLFHAHSLPIAYFAGPTGMTTISPDLLETERQVRQKMLEEQLGRVGIAADDLAGTVIEPGAPHRMLLETAADLSADLIVVGSSETPGRMLQGTTADRVLRKATCPVWVVRSPSRLPPRRILAPVDLSPLSEESLRRGLELIDRWQGDRLEIEALFVLTHEEIESSTQFTPDQIERLAAEELESFCGRLGRGEAMIRKVRIGEIREEILHDIGEAATDLVVVGTHGRSGFERFLLGSVASDMASRAPCSVLVIPPREAEE